MGFSEKLMTLRRRKGLSQEQLADTLGVTRQSVSKWEGGAAMPELVKLIALSELFGVTVDYLVKDHLEEPEEPGERWDAETSVRQTASVQQTDTARLEQKVDDLTRYVKGRLYAYDSRTRICGVPLVSVRMGFVRGQQASWEHVAKGIIAIGNAAVGVVSIGIVSVGAVSLGVTALGLLSLGVCALGLAAFGVVAFGAAAWGVCAIGKYAAGVAAVGTKIAVGVAASAPTAVGQEAAGTHVLLWGDGLTAAQVEAFLLEHHPDLWRPLLRVLSFFGAHIN